MKIGTDGGGLRYLLMLEVVPAATGFIVVGQGAVMQAELCIPTALGHAFLRPALLTLFQMRTGVGMPMTSQLKYTLAPVTFQMSLGGVTMEGPTREARKPSPFFSSSTSVRLLQRKSLFMRPSSLWII